MRLIFLAIIATCAVAGAARAQNGVMLQTMIVQQQTDNQMLRMQIEQERSQRIIQSQQEQNRQNLNSIGESAEKILHACDPGVLQRPGIHLLSRLGVCRNQAAARVPQQQIATAPRPLDRKSAAQRATPQHRTAAAREQQQRVVQQVPEYTIFDAIRR